MAAREDCRYLGHQMIDVADLPDGGVSFSKPYKHAEIVTSFRELTAGNFRETAVIPELDGCCGADHRAVSVWTVSPRQKQVRPW